MTFAAQLEQTLHHEIPIAHAMGIRVADYDGELLRLGMPLEPNLNHKCTAFGGSLYSLAVLCGWGLLHLKLAEAGLHRHIVIQEADIRYLRPIAQNMQAECTVDHNALQRFMTILNKHGRARLALDVLIKHNDQPAVTFSGRYVVHE